MPLYLFEIFESLIAVPAEVVQGFGVFLLMSGQVVFVHGFKSTAFVGAFP